jgi:hypothetical protein
VTPEIVHYAGKVDNLRGRLLLLKQDKLSILGQRLDEVDQQETSLLFLGKCRSDKNPDRISLWLRLTHVLLIMVYIKTAKPIFKY